MNIGNHGYSSWIHNTSQTGYGNAGRLPRTGENAKTASGDMGVINDADAEKKKTGEQDAEKNAADMTWREQILAHMEEMAKKVKEGKVEPTFQTGAQSFTIKEWEKLLADFDDAEEALQEQVKQLIAEVEAQAEKEALQRAAESGTAEPGEVTEVSVPETAQVTDPEETAALLTDEVTKCTYPTDDPKQKHWYITCYGQDGIMCKEAYFDGTKWVNKDCWSLSYTEPGQYEKVMAFLQRFPQDANLRFAAHENFWKDFLAGEIDEDDFVHFFETSTKDGVPDYTYEKDGSTYIDREKIKYAKYMNSFGARLYTGEEMDLIWRAIIKENSKHLQKISDYDGKMTIPDGAKTGDAKDEDDDLKTQIITKPDGSTVLQIETNFGVMEIEITEAQKFGLQYHTRPGAEAAERPLANPFTHTAAVDSTGER